MCVRNVDVQCVLQFTLLLAVGCVLHRPTSRVIHRSELSFCLRQLGNETLLTLKGFWLFGFLVFPYSLQKRGRVDPIQLTRTANGYGSVVGATNELFGRCFIP